MSGLANWTTNAVSSLLPRTTAAACVPHLQYTFCSSSPYPCAEFGPGWLHNCYGCETITYCSPTGQCCIP
jgi:hypothetical protein